MPLQVPRSNKAAKEVKLVREIWTRPVSAELINHHALQVVIDRFSVGITATRAVRPRLMAAAMIHTS